MSSISAAQGSVALSGFKIALDNSKRANETLANDLAEGSRKIQEEARANSGPGPGSRLDIRI